jgi:hypothetical protein
VVLRGSIVSDVVPDGGQAPRIVVDGALRISPSELLPGTAIYMPGGEVRTANGVNPSVQIEGDLIARELQLDARGAIHGQIASVDEPGLGSSIEQPLVCRTRKLRAPGLDR